MEDRQLQMEARQIRLEQQQLRFEGQQRYFNKKLIKQGQTLAHIATISRTLLEEMETSRESLKAILQSRPRSYNKDEAEKYLPLSSKTAMMDYLAEDPECLLLHERYVIYS